jgi:hypothetical protein
MAQSERRLRVTQAARVHSPVPARPTISAEKLAPLCNPLSNPSLGGTSQAPTLQGKVGYKNCRMWNSACKSLCKFVSAELFRRINAKEKMPLTRMS